MPAALYLYRFAVAGEVFRYTSNALDVTINLGDGNETFSKASIRSEDLRGGFLNSEGRVIMADTLRPAADYVAGAPNAKVILRVYDLAGTPAFGGLVASVSFSPDGREAALSIRPWNFAQALVPDRDVSPSCNYQLGDSRCGVNLTALGVVGTSVVVSSGGRVLTSAAWDALPDGYFAGGLVSLGAERALVVNHTGGALTIIKPLRSVSGVYTAFPGCDKAEATCNGKFANIDNFGGFGRVPGFNPSARNWEG